MIWRLYIECDDCEKEVTSADFDEMLELARYAQGIILYCCVMYDEKSWSSNAKDLCFQYKYSAQKIRRERLIETLLSIKKSYYGETKQQAFDINANDW